MFILKPYESTRADCIRKHLLILVSYVSFSRRFEWQGYCILHGSVVTIDDFGRQHESEVIWNIDSIISHYWNGY